MLFGIPCPHAICCIILRRHDPIDYVDDYYSKEAYLNAYAHPINLVPGIELWPEIHAPIQPPIFKRQRGRPKRARRREQDEEPPAPNVGATEAGTTKMPRRSYVVTSCTTCHEEDHNKRTFPIECAKARNTCEGKRNGEQRPIQVNANANAKAPQHALKEQV